MSCLLHIRRVQQVSVLTEQLQPQLRALKVVNLGPPSCLEGMEGAELSLTLTGFSGVVWTM